MVSFLCLALLYSFITDWTLDGSAPVKSPKIFKASFSMKLGFQFGSSNKLLTRSVESVRNLLASAGFNNFVSNLRKYPAKGPTALSIMKFVKSKTED